MFRRLHFLFILLAVFLVCALSGAAGPAPGKPKVVKVLRTTDKAQSNVYVPRAFEVKNANPYEVSSFLDDAVQAEGGLIATYANPEKGGEAGLILVVVPEYQLPAIEKVVAELDKPRMSNNSGTKFAFVNVKHRSVVNTHLAYTDATFEGTTDFVKSLLFFGGSDTEINEDVETNSLLISGAPSGVDAVVSAIVDYDVPREQIDIAVKVYEVEVKNDATLGLDFMSWKNGPGRDLFTVSLREYNIQDDVDGSRVWERGRSNIYGGTFEYTAEFFDFLAVKGKSRVVNRLRGTVINGFPATFQVFDDILHYPKTDVEVDQDGNRLSRLTSDAVDRGLVENLRYGVEIDPFGIAVGDAQAQSVASTAPKLESEASAVSSGLLNRGGIQEGLLLEVTPLIARNNIDLTVVTSLRSFLGLDGQGSPLVSERDVSTKVRAANGEEVVLGGIRRDRNIQMTRKVPFLGSIPVLGFLFGGEITGKKTVTVFEAVTPTILARGGLSEADKEIVKKATGTGSLRVPANEFGFDQHLIDR